MTYSQLDAAASSFAAFLYASGLKRGDRVAIHLPNGADFLAVQFGTLRLGTVAVYINFKLGAQEAQRQLDKADARVLVTTLEKARDLADNAALGKLMVIIAGEGASGAWRGLSDVLAGGGDSRFPAPGDLARGDAILRFTSGSTGLPKGVVVSHNAWLMRATAILTEQATIPESGTTMVLGPLTHGGGLLVLPTFLRRGTLILFDHFDLAAATAALNSGRVDWAQMVPTILRMFVDDPAAAKALQQPSLKGLFYGGSPISPDVLEQALALAPSLNFIQAYGSHETGSISCLNGSAHRDPRLRHSAGEPLLAVETRIEPREGQQYGEIMVRTPWSPHARIGDNGYEALDPDAWLPTGDLGAIEDGFIFLKDRANDVIISGGFNVYPNEIEGVLNRCPDVAVSAVTSAPDERWGEKVIAFIVRRSGSAIDAEAMREFARSGLARFKVPKDFIFIDEMPLNAAGKIDRKALSEPLWKGRSRRIN